ncbi:MAG: DUF362 domain-containing protein [candidate division Zixibacteria bacterium]|nr:DUF362 domain-containing protein [Candidatus Tariuqbacter arcticus]
MKLTRRDFVKGGAAAASTAALASTGIFTFSGRSEAAKRYRSSVMVSKGGSPAENVLKVITALGGMEKFVMAGDRVLLKPNSISSAGPESAINTNPEVVGEVVRLCRKAGAREILAMTHDDASAWGLNGIGEAIEANGGSVMPANDVEQYQGVNLPRGIILRVAMVVKELLEFEVFINIPVAKHHGGVQLTLGMKNLMGLNWDRYIMHRTDIHQTIADLATVRRPDITIIDATRMLLTNGPSGPGTVRVEDAVIGSTDPVAADAYTATLFEREPHSVRHIQHAYELGLGEIELDMMDIQRFNLAG